MCLGTIYGGKKEQSELANLPKMVKCWKVVELHRNSKKYWPEWFNKKPFKIGWNIIKPKSKSTDNGKYKVAFHAFLTKEAAKDWSDLSQKVIQCKTEKKDIVAIGTQAGKLCIVTKRIWIPKPKKKKKKTA